LDLSQLIKIDGEPYSRLKLIAELSKISSKTSENDVAHTVDTIESRLLHLVRHSHKITKEIFTAEVIAVLKKLDQSSYLRYMAQIQEA
jgi:transcriptional regulator NrdR family protein